LWCADYKGEFMLADKRYCYPLTVTDSVSRYLLCSDALATTKRIKPGNRQRKAATSACICCIGRRKINLSTVFAGQNVGVKEVSDKIIAVHSSGVGTLSSTCNPSRRKASSCSPSHVPRLADVFVGLARPIAPC
jgi:hypothetical protein